MAQRAACHMCSVCHWKVHHTRDQDTFPFSTRRCKAVVNHGTDGMGSHARERVIELSDFHCVISACLVVVGHINPRCSRKKRTGEIRERNAGVSVPKQRGRQQRKPSSCTRTRTVKHCSTSSTNTDVSVRSAEKCPLSVERSKEAQLCSSGSAVCELDVRLN